MLFPRTLQVISLQRALITTTIIMPTATKALQTRKPAAKLTAVVTKTASSSKSTNTLKGRSNSSTLPTASTPSLNLSDHTPLTSLGSSNNASPSKQQLSKQELLAAAVNESKKRKRKRITAAEDADEDAEAEARNTDDKFRRLDRLTR